MSFEWDHGKAKTNLKKHGISFDEAASAFDDPAAVIFDDEEHSAEEARSIIVGYSIIGRLLLVSFTERKPGSRLRIISARKATRKEQRAHETHIRR
jgi:uncharacterized protein